MQVEHVYQVEQVRRDLRKRPIFRQLIPQEAAIGWPIPLRKEGQVYMTFVFFGMLHQKELQQTALFPPFASLTLNWARQQVVKYVDLTFEHPWPEGDWTGKAGTFPHAAIADLSVGAYEQKQQELFGMYDEMVVMLAQGNSFAPDWTSTFSERLGLLMEPGLEAFYRALAPKFFSHFLIK